MILKSYLLEQNISLIDKYFINLIYGENIGMKDDIKDQINIYFKNHEKVLFTQDEILKKKDISEVDATKEAKKIENVEKNLRNKKIIKKIFVKNKIINFIVV